MGLVGAVREGLGFQTDGAKRAIHSAFFPWCHGFCLPCGINLNPRAVGCNCHSDAAFFGRKGGGRFASRKQNEIMVDSAGPGDGACLLQKPIGKQGFFCEIHLASKNRADFAGHKGIVITGAKSQRRKTQFVLADVGLRRLAIQIKIGVVGEVDHRILIGNCLIGEAEFTVFAQKIGHRKLQFAGKSLVHMRGNKRKTDLLIRKNPGGKKLGEKAAKTAVQMVGAVVAGKGVFLPVQRKTPLSDPVGKTADGCAHIAVVGIQISVGGFKTKSEAKRS